MRVAATLQVPSKGQVRFDGLVALAEPRSLRGRLGYLPQDFGVYPGVSAEALLDQVAVLKGVVARSERRELTERLLRLVNLWDARRRAVSTFSGGMRQRWGVAQALIGNPDLLILDEPTAGLDPTERNRFHELLFELGESAVVIVSTHIVEDVADLCTRVAVLANGRVAVEGTPAQLAGALDGKVWCGPAGVHSGNAAILTSRLSSGRRIARVLAGECPAPGFKPAPAELEDAYFAALTGDREVGR
jgi:ABC-type multidrug transport system ATPase subunit